MVSTLQEVCWWYIVEAESRHLFTSRDSWRLSGEEDKHGDRFQVQRSSKKFPNSLKGMIAGLLQGRTTTFILKLIDLKVPKVWSPDQLHQHHLSENSLEVQIYRSCPRYAESRQWWRLIICDLTSILRDLDAYSNLQTAGLEPHLRISALELHRSFTVKCFLVSSSKMNLWTGHA